MKKLQNIESYDNPLLQAAVDWQAAGFSVVPVGKNKIPRISWAAQQATPWTRAQVIDWWVKNPNDNVAVIPGTGGMAVIDADIYKQGGAEDLIELFLAHGLDHGLAVVTKTGSGGRHYWFQCPGGTASRPLTDTIDMKSNGGMVIVPPSVNEKGIYEWESVDFVDDFTMGGIVPPLPLSLARENRGVFQDGSPKSAVSSQTSSSDNVTLFRAKDGRERLMRDAVWWAGHTMLASGLSLDDHLEWLEIAWQRFETMAKGRDGVPLEQEHTRETMLYKIRRTNIDRLLADYIQNRNEGQKGPERGDDTSDGDDGGGDDTPTTREARRFVVEPWGSDDFASENRYLVQGLLSPKALSVLYGPSNSGKTFQAMALAYAVGTGTPFCGMRTARGRVVYLAAEGATNIRKRRAAIKTYFADEIAALEHEPNVDLIGDSFDFVTANVDVPELAEVIGKADLIIVDTLSAVAAGGDENTAPTMLSIIANAYHLINKTGAHVMLIHHMGKNEEKGARGHSSLRAALDTEIEISKTAGTSHGRMKVTKQRDMEIIAPIGFKLVPVVISEDGSAEEITSCIVQQTEFQQNQAKLSAAARGLQRIIYNKFAAPNRAPRPQRIEVNGTMLHVQDAIDSADVRDSFKNLPENDASEAGAVRQRYRRALREVCSSGALVYGSEKIGLLKLEHGSNVSYDTQHTA